MTMTAEEASKRLDAMERRIDDVIADFEHVVSRLEGMTPDERKALVRRVTAEE